MSIRVTLVNANPRDFPTAVSWQWNDGILTILGPESLRSLTGGALEEGEEVGLVDSRATRTLAEMPKEQVVMVERTVATPANEHLARFSANPSARTGTGSFVEDKGDGVISMSAKPSDVPGWEGKDYVGHMR